MKRNDLTGRTFGRLEVLGRVYPVVSPHSLWWVRCECGTVEPAYRERVKRGQGCRGCAGVYGSERQSRVAIGDRFGLLEVQGVEMAGRYRVAVCRCECGRAGYRVRAATLLTQAKRNRVTACGCARGRRWDRFGKPAK